MRKVVAAINMTLDGYCDHTAITPDEEIHHHYANLLRNGDAILYGRKTYELMQYWQGLVKNPSGDQSMDDFAIVMDRIPKIVFSHMLEHTDWHSAKLADQSPEQEVLALRKSSDGGSKDLLVGSRSIIMQLIKLNLIDELQLCVHPVVAGGGLPLFENINGRVVFKLIKTKTFAGGAVLLYYGCP